MKKFLILFMFLFLFFIFISSAAFCADISGLEREALAMRVELNRLGSSGDPFEREAILQKIIDKCKGTEEAVAAYWDLADLYLDGFPEEMRQEAREMLEICLKNYPNSSRASMIKCRLVDLYDAQDLRREELIKQLQNDKTIPNILRSSMK